MAGFADLHLEAQHKQCGNDGPDAVNQLAAIAAWLGADPKELGSVGPATMRAVPALPAAIIWLLPGLAGSRPERTVT